MRIIKKIIDIGHLLISTCKKRDNNIYIFGSWYGEKFADNPKYLFLYFLKHKKNAYWVTRSTDIFETMKKKQLPVCLIGTKSERQLLQKAKYFFYCCSLDDIDKYYAGGATTINLWHGVPLKKIMYDDTYNYNTGRRSLYQKMSNWLMNKSFNNNYVVSTSSVFSQIYQRAFRLDESHVLNMGQPRNDCFFDGSLCRKKYGNKKYSKLVTYMPTMRNMGKDIIDLNNIMDLSRIDRLCRENNALLIIKKHFCHRNEKVDLDSYTNIVDMTSTSIDTQELLFNTDILITDYSSCYIDYMLLDRQIIFYAYDLKDYLLKDREMYFPYDKVTPGAIVTNFDQLYEQIDLGFKGDYQIDENYRSIKNLFYDLPNQGVVSKRIMEWVDQIDRD